MKTNLMKYLFAVTFAVASINATPNLKPQMPMPSVINPASIPAQTPIPKAADSIAATKNEQNTPRNLSPLYAFSPAFLAVASSIAGVKPKSVRVTLKSIENALDIYSYLSIGATVVISLSALVDRLQAEQKSIAEDKKTA